MCLKKKKSLTILGSSLHGSDEIVPTVQEVGIERKSLEIQWLDKVTKHFLKFWQPTCGMWHDFV